MLCTEARQLCKLEPRCDTSQKLHQDYCFQRLDEIETNKNCSEQCKLTIYSMARSKSKLIHQYFDCDCGKNDLCYHVKEKTNLCNNSAYFEPVSCPTAIWFCINDQDCLSLWEKYHYYCLESLANKICTRVCFKSVLDLWGHHSGFALKDCICMEESEYCNHRHILKASCFPEVPRKMINETVKTSFSSTCMNVFSFLVMILFNAYI